MNFDFNDKVWRDLNGKLFILPNQADPFFRNTILTQQIGDISKCLVYMRVYEKDKTAYKAFRAEFKIALADLYAQIRAFADMYNLDMNEIDGLALARINDTYDRRLKEFIETGVFHK